MMKVSTIVKYSTEINFISHAIIVFLIFSASHQINRKLFQHTKGESRKISKKVHPINYNNVDTNRMKMLNKHSSRALK
jgi:hypothetical protein